MFDCGHSINKNRWIPIGKVVDVLFVVFTERKKTIRFISARLTTNTEKKLYFTVDTKKICHMAFQLLKFSIENNMKYTAFCMEEVYGNYLAAFYEITEKYKDRKEIEQAEPADKIIKEHNRILEKRKQCYRIRDLQPSRMHSSEGI